MKKTNSPVTITLEEFKEKIEAIQLSNPNIHINLNKTRKKLQNHPVFIKSVHRNFFIVENRDGEFPASYTIQYAELLTKEIDVIELNELH